MRKDQLRWQQRFTNLEKAFKKLERGLEIFDYDRYLQERGKLKSTMEKRDEKSLSMELDRLDLDREGIIQRFEYSFELFLLTLKDLLEFMGEPKEELLGKRAILKIALRENLITDHDNWRKMLLSRNLTSHTYDEETADEVTENILRIYFPLMKKLYATLEKQHKK